MEVHVTASKEEIQFQPLSEGLGFHPFANGLPYTPPTRTQKVERVPVGMGVSMGVGAEAAGKPVFARPAPKTVPNLSIPVVTPSPLLEVDENFGLAYSFKRVLAFSLDCTIHSGLAITALSCGLWKQGINPEMLLNSGILIVAVLFLCFFNWAMTTAQEIAFGTTAGKRVFGLHLEGETSAVFIRAVLFVPSLLFCGIGIFWAFGDANWRCWHDVASGIQPREVARL